MNNVITRTLSGIVLIIVFAGLLLLGKYTSLALLLFVFSVAMYEIRKMLDSEDQVLFFISLTAGMISMGISYFILDGFIRTLWMPAVITGFVLLFLFMFTLRGKTGFRQTSQIFLSVFWIAGSLIFYFALGWLPANNGFNPELMIILLALVWINDIGAFVAGKLIGRTPLAKAISPEKTMEGLTGGIVLNAAAGYLVYTVTNSHTAIFWITMAILVSITSAIGDLFESKLKRETGVKDSGNIIPGHGGMLDRFDSLMFSAPVFYSLFLIIEKL
ncbi:MAG: phosphatidate cytidylyltransferase [Bacteroidales bacterium]|nr:phosphatidate cytidylyltransferase [Bacteroidales bacterium]